MSGEVRVEWADSKCGALYKGFDLERRGEMEQIWWGKRFGEGEI